MCVNDLNNYTYGNTKTWEQIKQKKKMKMRFVFKTMFHKVSMWHLSRVWGDECYSPSKLITVDSKFNRKAKNFIFVCAFLVLKKYQTSPKHPSQVAVRLQEVIEKLEWFSLNCDKILLQLPMYLALWKWKKNSNFKWWS